ncbi:DUF5675 family protein [Spirosoma areae]
MELRLSRIDRAATYTGGILSVQKAGKWVPLCSTLEDPIRELGPAGEGKIKGNTAILAGRYRVKLTFSERFGKVLPLLLGVLFFAGIRIHVGNWTADTDGCILVGLKREGNTLKGSIAAMKLLMDVLTQADKDNQAIYITIVNS